MSKLSQFHPAASGINFKAKMFGAEDVKDVELDDSKHHYVVSSLCWDAYYIPFDLPMWGGFFEEADRRLAASKIGKSDTISRMPPFACGFLVPRCSVVTFWPIGCQYPIPNSLFTPSMTIASIPAGTKLTHLAKMLRRAQRLSNVNWKMDTLSQPSI